MASFLYVARESDSSREFQSSIKAATECAAVAALQNRHLMVLHIREDCGRMRTWGGRVPLAELVIFTRQLGTMINAGLPLIQGLKVLAEQTHAKAMRDVIRDLCRRVEGGDSFSTALAEHPKTFSRLYVSMVDGGERGGLLAKILDRLAAYLESTARLRRKVKSAALYPILVAGVAILITLFLLTYVVPVFGEVFRNFGAELPAPTRSLIALSDWVKRYLLLLLLGGGGVAYTWLYFITTPFGRHVWDYYRIRMPIFGDLAHKICLARLSRTFASLVHSGVPILEVMQIVSRTVGNVVIEKAVRAMALDVEQGQPLSKALSKHSVFPGMIVRMVNCGEQTGDVDGMLERVADYLDDEVEVKLGGLMVLIEPLLIVFLGVVVGGMVICMFLPIFKLPEIVSRR